MPRSLQGLEIFDVSEDHDHHTVRFLIGVRLPLLSASLSGYIGDAYTKAPHLRIETTPTNPEARDLAPILAWVARFEASIIQALRDDLEERSM